MTVLNGRLKLETIDYNQSGWDSIHNTNMQRMNDFVEKLAAQDPVIDKDLNTPPGSPSAGDRYLINTSPTGAWSGKAKNIAEWNGVEWRFTTPVVGFTCLVKDEKRYYSYNDAGNWVTKDFAATADATVTNTIAETTIIGAGVGSLSLPANFFTVGKTLLIKAYGLLSTQATPPTLNIRIKLGATVIMTTGDVTPEDSLTNRMWKLEAVITCRTVGGSGSVMAQGMFQYMPTNPGSLICCEMANTAAVTIDTTAALALDITAQWGSGVSSGDSVKGMDVVVEVVG